MIFFFLNKITETLICHVNFSLEFMLKISRKGFFLQNKLLAQKQVIVTVGEKRIFFFIHFITNESTHILRNINFQTQGLQIAALQQRYSPFKCKKTLILDGSTKKISSVIFL